MKWRPSFQGDGCQTFELRDDLGRCRATVWPAPDVFGRPRHMGQERWFASVLNAAVDSTSPLHASVEAAKRWCDERLAEQA